MSVVYELYDVTTELHQLLDKEVDKDHRDEIIAKIESLLEKRDDLMKELKGSYSIEEERLGKEIVRLNQFINARLVTMKTNIQLDLNKIKNKKTTNQRYSNPYESVNPDGMFFDKRN